MQDIAGIDDGSNKQSTQSNEEEENKMDLLNNINYNPINSLENNIHEKNKMVMKKKKL